MGNSTDARNENSKNIWIRDKPSEATPIEQYDFFVPKMEFEEFMVLFGKWYAGDKLTAGFIGIRSDESLHRYRAIVSDKKNKDGSISWIVVSKLPCMFISSYLFNEKNHNRQKT